jgi:hypothetical protein
MRWIIVDLEDRLRRLRAGEFVPPERTIHYMLLYFLLLFPALLVVGLLGAVAGTVLLYTNLPYQLKGAIYVVTTTGAAAMISVLHPLGPQTALQFSQSSFRYVGWWWRASSIPYSRIRALRWRVANPIIYPGVRSLNLLCAKDDSEESMMWTNLHSSGGGWTKEFAEAVRDEIVERCGLVRSEHHGEPPSDTADTYWTKPGCSRDDLPPVPWWMG